MLARRRILMAIFIVLTFLPAFLLSHQIGMTTQTASPVAIEATPVTAVTETSCPEIIIDDVSYTMDVRAEPSDDHPVTVCETSVPPGSASVLVGEGR